MLDDELQEEMCVEVQHHGAWQAAKVIGPVKTTSVQGTRREVKTKRWIVALKSTNLHLNVEAEDLRACAEDKPLPK